MSAEPDQPELRALAVRVFRGTSNNILQVATLVRAATALGARVDVFFEGPALDKLQVDRIEAPDWSSCYALIKPALVERLQVAELSDMATFLRDAKQHGDDTHFWASMETLADVSYTIDQLVPILDGAMAAADFEAAALRADALLRF